MADYTALQTAWNSVILPPTGVTGQRMLGGDTTAQKITKVNAWTVTGAIPKQHSLPAIRYSIASTIPNSRL